VVEKDVIISSFSGYIATSGYRSLSQSLSDTFSELAMANNPGFAVEISVLSAIIPEI